MLLLDLLKVMDGDTTIHVEQAHQEVYHGCAGSINLPIETLQLTVDCIWYSALYNAIWIDI